jgi:hypothetical protein
VLNDTGFDVAADGSFEILLGGPEQPRNWMALGADASRVTTRHYYEEKGCPAADTSHSVPL